MLFKKTNHYYLNILVVFFILFLTLFLTSCQTPVSKSSSDGGGGGGSSNSSDGGGSTDVALTNAWTWVSGSNTKSQSGTYGTKGTAGSSNIPGARSESISWIDSSNNLWLFGGQGYDSAGNTGFLNDLWKFDGTNWTWVSGSSTGNQSSSYGTKGTAGSSNIPGARYKSISWIDSSNNLWLFGGYFYDGSTEYCYNDLWKFDGTNWTWISGSDTKNQSGTYGTKGTAGSSNIPGARDSSISWIDSSNNLWLFGGNGYDSTGSGNLNDLWKFDGTNWTWISGSDTKNQSGTYGTKGTTGSSNIPGARDSSISWIDSSNNLWLFGGYFNDNFGIEYWYNDLWKFDGSNWTWISGNDTANQSGSYGTKGTAGSSNIPGARDSSISWIDSSGNLWLFGGLGYDSVGNRGFLNDLWKYKP